MEIYNSNEDLIGKSPMYKCICFSYDTAVLATHQHVKVCIYLWDQNGICHHYLHGVISNWFV